jgi:hypothetical protein
VSDAAVLNAVLAPIVGVLSQHLCDDRADHTTVSDDQQARSAVLRDNPV